MTRTEKSYVAALAISIAWIFYLYSYAARIEPAILFGELTGEFHITSKEIGYFSLIAYIPYVIMQIPCGIITDKLGIKRILAISNALCALGAFTFASAHSVFQLDVGRFLIGLAGAPAFLCCGKVASEFFDKRRFSMLMGMAMVFGCLGGILGGTPAASLVSSIGWRSTTFIIAALGGVLAVLSMVFLKNKPKEEEGVSKEKSNLLGGLKILVKNPKIWILGFYGAMSYLPLSAIAEMWGVPFISARYGIPTTQAAISSSVIFVGFALGGVVSAWIAEKINSYKKTIILFTLGVAISFWTAICVDGIGYALCLALMFLGGLFAGANTLCFTIAFNSVPKEYSGTSSGFMNTLIMASAIFFPALLGKSLDFFRNGLVTDAGVPIYNITAYRSAFLIVIAALALAAIATFFISDIKHNKEEKA